MLTDEEKRSIYDRYGERGLREGMGGVGGKILTFCSLVYTAVCPCFEVLHVLNAINISLIILKLHRIIIEVCPV